MSTNIQDWNYASKDFALNALRVVNVEGLVPKEFDYIALTYVSSGNGVGEVET